MSSAPRGQRSALPAALRVPAVAAIGLAVLVFVVLAARYTGDATGGRFDVRADAVAAALAPGHRRPSLLAVSLGGPRAVIVLAGLLAALCLALGRWRSAVVAVVGPGLTGLATTGLKPLVGRTIDGGWAFPSGHTGGATALGLVAGLVVVGVGQLGRRSGVVTLAAGALAAGGGMAVALALSDIHYLTDTIGGFCTAVAVVLGTALLVDRVADTVIAGGSARRPRWPQPGGP